MDGVVGKNERPGARAGAHDVGRPRMVAIGEKNFCDAHARNIREGLVARRHRIDSKAAVGVENRVAVEVVPVRLGKPRPGKNIATISFTLQLPFSAC